jgi:hypothetical protein
MEINKIVEKKMFDIRIIAFTNHHVDRQIPPLNANTKCNTDPPCTL